MSWAACGSRMVAPAIAIASLGGCGAGSSPSAPEPPKAAEPAESPPLAAAPAGTVTSIGSAAEGLVADPVTGIVAAGVADPPALVLLRGADGRVLRRISLPASPRHLSLARPGGPVLVPAEDADTLVRVNLPGGSQAGVGVGRHPHDAAFAAGRTFVSDEYAGTVSVIGGRRVLETIETGGQPGGIASAAGRVALVDVRRRRLDVFSAPGAAAIATLDAGEGPTHAVAGLGGDIFLADTQGNAILRYSLRPTPRLLARTPLGGTPYGIAFDRRRRHLWVTQTARNRVVELLVGPRRVDAIRSFATVRQPNSVAVDASSGLVFVAGSHGGQLQRIKPPDLP